MLLVDRPNGGRDLSEGIIPHGNGRAINIKPAY